MRTDLLLDAIGEVRDDYLEDAEKDAKALKARRMRIWLSAAAAVFCLMVAGGVFYITHRPTYRDMQQWSTSMTAKDYFANSVFGHTTAISSNASLVIAPCTIAASLDDQRENLEAEGILPEMPQRKKYYFTEFYNGDGSIYKLVFRWNDEAVFGKQLELTVAPKELHETKDLIIIYVDSDGNELPKQTTVTERDGIKIYAEGRENEYKTVTWQNAYGWYQITGCPDDSYEDMISLLDWFWEHPIDFERFAVPNEGTFIISDGSQLPEGYAAILSVMDKLGYSSENKQLYLFEYDGKARPVYYKGEYTRGETRIRLELNEGADKKAWENMLGSNVALSEESIDSVVSQKRFLNMIILPDSSKAQTFAYLLTLTVEQGTGADAWEIVQAIQNVAKIMR